MNLNDSLNSFNYRLSGNIDQKNDTSNILLMYAVFFDNKKIIKNIKKIVNKSDFRSFKKN